MQLKVICINEVSTQQWKLWHSMLSPEEQRRAARYRQLADHKAFVAGRGLVRILAARHFSLPAHNIQISTSATGKPFLEGLEDRFQFSISHSTAYLAVLWHPGQVPLGVDIECFRQGFDYQPILQIYFSESERQQVHSAVDFLRFWTMKEAILKAAGTGMVDDLHLLDLSDYRNSPVVFQGKAYRLRNYTSDGWIVAVATLSNSHLPMPPVAEILHPSSIDC